MVATFPNCLGGGFCTHTKGKYALSLHPTTCVDPKMSSDKLNLLTKRTAELRLYIYFFMKKCVSRIFLLDTHHKLIQCLSLRKSKSYYFPTTLTV